jgi:HD-GYP domain-containing protein (c-di-GMP phosphodiesterase class II)
MTEWYNGKGGFLSSKREEIPLAARILPAAFTASLFDTLAGADAATSAIQARSGSIIDPAVSDAFVRTGASILAELNTLDLLRRLPDEEPERALEVPADQIDEVVIAFGEAVDLKAPFTHGAARRAFELAHTAASALSLEATDVAAAGRAAALRDIGKAAIPSKLLEKPGTLTEIEWEAVRLHAYHSERVLSRSPSLTTEATLAGLHHERTDGSGYHRGTAGSAIPIAAQIIAVTDELVAMTQPRPYRPAISLDHACRDIERQSRASKFDPQVARAVTAAAHGTSDRFRRTMPAGLSDRQIEVLRLIAEGLTNRQIAERLVVSPRTAEHHVQDIYLKIGTSSRAAAALFAVEHQLL